MTEILLSDTPSALENEMESVSNEKFGVTFWQATDMSVVIGLGGHEEKEVYADVADAEGVKILKRRSGGGTVVLGPGVLCFSLVIPGRKELCNPVGLAQEIMPLAAAALGDAGFPCDVRGSGDLAINGKKICGIAQKWTRKAILFHGSILVDFDIALIEKLLPHPPREPDYRGRRRHREFCTTLVHEYGKALTVKRVAEILNQAFQKYLQMLISGDNQT